MVHLVILTFLTYFLSMVGASLYVGFPFSEQLPDVARVDEKYNFQMANITYKSTGGSVSYSASNLPDWLSFDELTRTFSGVPSSGDVSNSVSITLTGVDSADGSTITNNYTILVTADPGLALSSNDVMFTEISQYGRTNGENGLVVKAGQTFDIKFDSSTFQMDKNSTREIVAYYGRLIDRLSLPNWIRFDEDELSFSGTVPTVTSDIAPSIDYGFSFIATDYEGYAGAVGNFYLVVGAHELSTSLNESIKINGTLNTDFDVSVPIFTSVYQDGDLISQENISSVYSDSLPDYVTLNTANYTLTGVFPETSHYENFTIIVEDKYGNSIDIPYLFDALGSAFTVDDLPNVNVTKGQWLDYQLLDSLFTESNETNVTVSYSADWLKFNQDNTTFLGTVPKDFDEISVKVTATNEFDSDEKSFNFVGVSSNKTTNSTSNTSSSSSSSSSSTASSTSSSSASNGSKNSKSSLSNKQKLAIGLGVGIPVFLIICVLLLFFCCYRRRNNDKREKDKFYDKHIVPVKNLDYEKGGAAGGKKKRRKDQEPELDGPGFGTTVDNDDHDEDPHQLSALNVLKLDEKKKDNSDSKSTSSSLTQVESEYSNYFDASERPVKSWRAGGEGDNAVSNALGPATLGAAAAAAAIKYNNIDDENHNKNRQSIGTMSTVNTENLFSVRLVEDHSNRDSNQSSFGSAGLGGQQYLTETSINSILKRDDSGNIQRLDSDGNIVDLNILPREAALEVAAGSSEPLKPRLSRSASSNLDILMEENSKDRSHDESTIYHSSGDREHSDVANTTNNSTIPQQTNDVHTEHSFNLLSRFNNSASSSAANSDQQLNSRLYGSDNSLVDEFKAVHNDDGELQWSEANTDSKNNSSSFLQKHQKHQQNEFSNADHSMEDDNLTSQISAMKDQFPNNSNPEINHRYSSSSLGRKAKLVEFTRKGSLRDAAKLSGEHNYFSGQTAYIHDDDSE